MHIRLEPAGRALRKARITVALPAGLLGCGGDDGETPPPPPPPVVGIATVSNRADLISGGDALVEIALPAGTMAAGLRVDVDGADVSSAFTVRGDGRVTGVVTGLKEGDNVVSASTNSTSAAKLTITNANRGGPVYSGAAPLPFVCATAVPLGATDTGPATNGSGLSAAASDARCNIATEYKLYYRSTAAGCSMSLPDPVVNTPYAATTPTTTATPAANLCFRPFTQGTTPADLATTTTDAGVTVPYIVRVERGTMNRGIYDIAVLFDPARSWTGAVPQPQWNRKVYFVFGASTGQPRRQVRPATPWTDDRALGRGYAVAVNSMTDSLKNSNRVLMTETTMMMKEHITDNYGPIRFTIGSGCSGGSIASNMISSISPGLLDGITLSCTFADSETVATEVADCTLLVEAYQKPQWLALQAGLTPAQFNARKAAINGHRDQTACHGWFNSFGSNAKAGNFSQRLVPAGNNANGAIVQSANSINNCELLPTQVYDPVTNPGGARCNAWSFAESIWGRVAGQPAAKDTRDNVGVQYGLKALQSGAISGEEFVTLNEIIGGTDRDTNLVATRSVADADALTIAYRAGIVLSGKQIAKTAIIDMRGYDDSVIDLPPGFAGIPPASLQGVALFGIHQQWRSFSIRDRLDRDNVGHGNQVIWRFGRSGFSAPAALAADAFTQMDTWLAAIKADTGTRSIEQKIVSAKPAATADYCLLSSDPSQAVKITDQALCDGDSYLAPGLSPRQVAGGPRTEDVLKCQLKPLNAADYGSRLTAAQLARLQAVFAGGVCDWSRPGVGQQDSASPLNFKGGPGGVAFGPAPVSVAR